MNEPDTTPLEIKITVEGMAVSPFLLCLNFLEQLENKYGYETFVAAMSAYSRKPNSNTETPSE